MFLININILKTKLAIVFSIFLSLLISLFVATWLLPVPTIVPVPRVNLNIVLDQSADQSLTLNNLFLGKGHYFNYDFYLPEYFYLIRISDNNKKVLFTGKVTYVSEFEMISTSRSKKTPISTSKPRRQLASEILLILPFYRTAKYFEILDEKNILKLTVDLDSFHLVLPKEVSHICGDGICEFKENFLSCYRDCVH